MRIRDARRRWGDPIAEAPAIQERIGVMAVKLEAARAAYETARLWRDHPDLRERLPARIAAAKYLCTNAACQASEAGLRVAGGFSQTADLSLERHFRDAFQPRRTILRSASSAATRSRRRGPRRRILPSPRRKKEGPHEPAAAAARGA